MMLRRLLLYLSIAGWARSIVTHWGLARRVALRFVAGETLGEAINVTQALNAKGLLVTLDYLGESITRAEDTQEVVDTYRAMIEQIHAHKLQASVSLKLTHLGLDIGEDLCQTNLRHILTAAKSHQIPVTIDMESSAYTETTLRIYRTMRDDYDFDNVGTVIQAYLHRSKEDMRQLAAEGSHIRLCKGAYLEPPEVAFPEKSDVDKNYVELARDYLQSESYLCIATHDEKMIQAVEGFIKAQNISQERYEFQMLYGIRSARQEELVAAGYKMRAYVPFGSAWYPYFMRRLAERPANLWFFTRALFRR
jgi:proline dehydrogenase